MSNPYSLRPGNKLKRPARYEDELDTSPEPGSATHDPVTNSHSSSSSAAQTVPPLRHPPARFPSAHCNDLNVSPAITITPASPAAQGPYPKPPTRDADNARGRRKMANVKFIKKRAIADEQQEDEQQEDEHEDILKPARRTGGRPSKVARAAAAATTPANDLTDTAAHPKPAATFPSLPTTAPPSLPVVTGDFAGNGMREMMEALEKGNEEAVTAMKRHVDGLYAKGAEEWYKELRRQWVHDMSKTEVTFNCLWPSLRQTIIEQIRDDIPSGIYLDSYYPVARILNIPKNELHTIMAENAHVWDDDEIPQYFLVLRKKNPDAVIDPDEPPPPELAKAIKFLKQNSLSGTLLGEWQDVKMLPSTEDFTAVPLEDTLEVVDSVELDRAPHPYPLDHPDVLSLEQTWKVLARDKARTASKLQRKRDDVQVRLQARCRRCKSHGAPGIGHTPEQIDGFGVAVCPYSRTWSAKHVTERNALQHQARVEIALIAQRGLAAQNAPPAPVPTGHAKTQLMLQAWHASQGTVDHARRFMTAQCPKSKEQYLQEMQKKGETHLGLARDRYMVRELREQLDADPEVYGLAVEVECLTPIQSSNLERPPTPDFQIPSELVQGEGDWDDVYSETPDKTSEDIPRTIDPSVLTIEKSSPPDRKRSSETMEAEDEDIMDIDAQPTFRRIPWEAPLGPLPPSYYTKSPSHMIGPYPAHASKPLWPNGSNIQRSFTRKPTGTSFQQHPPLPPSQQHNPLHPPSFYQQQHYPNQPHLAPYTPHLLDQAKAPKKVRGPYKKKQKLDSGSASGKPTPNRVVSKDGVVSLAASPLASPLVQKSGLVSLGSSREVEMVLEEQRKREGLQQQQQVPSVDRSQMGGVSLGTLHQAGAVLDAQRRVGLMGSQSQPQTPYRGQAQPPFQIRAQSPFQTQLQPPFQAQAQPPPQSRTFPHPLPQIRRPSISNTGPSTAISRDGDANTDVHKENGTQGERPPYPIPTPVSTVNGEVPRPSSAPLSAPEDQGTSGARAEGP